MEGAVPLYVEPLSPNHTAQARDIAGVIVLYLWARTLP